MISSKDQKIGSRKENNTKQPTNIGDDINMVAKKQNTNTKQQDAVATKPAKGQIKVRGRTFVGTVKSDKMTKTVVVTWVRRVFVKKFERYETRVSRLNAHNPDEIGAKKGDIVEIAETRPLSKTKNFIVTKIIGKASAKEHIKTETIEEEDSKEYLTKKRDESKDDEE